MAGLLDFFSGGSDADLYGGLLSEAQRRALTTRGLASMAEKFGQLAMPQRAPIPLGAVLGQGFGAYGAGTDEAVKTAFEAQLKGAQAQKLQSEIEYAKQLAPLVGGLDEALKILASGGTGGPLATSGSTGGAAVSPGAGGGGGPGSDPRGMVPHITAEATRLGIDPAIALQVARSEGLGTFSGDGGKSGGAFQLYTGGGMGNDFQRDTGLNPLDPKNEKATITYALEQAAQKGWGAWNGAKKLGITGFAGIGKPGAAPTAAAPAPAGGGGLLASAAPNPLSDADPMAGILRPAVGRQPLPGARAMPGAPTDAQPGDVVGGLVFRGGNPGDPRNWVAAPTGAYTEGSGGGGPLAAAPDAGGDPIMSVTSADQAGGGEAPAAAPPRAALPTMGPTGVELPPMQGPLAAPAPAAAAAPAAAGPGLLSPQGAAPAGLPPAAALPQVNPAYANVLAQIARLRAQSELAGIKNDPFAAFSDALKASPAYAAQLEIARRAAGLPFVAAETTAKKAAEEPFDIRASERALGNSLTEKGWRLVDGKAVRIPEYDKMQEATAFATAKGTGEGGLPTTLFIKSVENQNKIIADAAQNGNQVTFDKDGKMTVSRLPGADTAAQAAAAAAARGTGSVEPATALRQGPGGPYEAPTTKTALADEVSRAPTVGLPGGVAAPGPNAPIGGLVGKPVYTPGQITAQEAAATNNEKLIQTYRETADAAASAKTTLQNISGDIGSMVHGPFAPAAQLASSYLRILDPSFNKQVSSYEDLYSNANELVRKAVRQSDPNPSFIQTQMAFQSLPVPEKSPDGLRIITNRMIGVNDHDTARAAAIPVYAQEHGGSNAGFDTWWRGNASPYAFVFMKMAPQDQQALVAKLNTNPQGQREIAKLKQQIAFINKNGLEQ